MMAIREHKILIQEYVEKVWNKCDFTALKNLTAPTFTYIIGGQPARNLEAMQHFLSAIHTAFPDWKVEIVDRIIEDNKVVIQWIGQVTHLGDFNGIPATGKKIAVSGMNIYHIINGKIASEWEQTDTIGMLQQLGVLPVLKQKI
jgi:steroid delta-isomerase-like uncharacterized protein